METLGAPWDVRALVAHVYPDPAMFDMLGQAVLVETAVMEATVHLLDLADAVGAGEPSPRSPRATRGLLIAVPDPTAAVEVLAGRAAPAVAVPAIR